MHGESRDEVSGVATRGQNSYSLVIRLAINKVVCKKQDSLIVQLFLNDNSIQSRVGQGLYGVVSS